jgi:hypothetical protein
MTTIPYRQGCVAALQKVGVDVGSAGNYLGTAIGAAVGTATGGPMGGLAGSAVGGLVGDRLINVPANMALDAARRMSSQYHTTRNYLNEPVGITPYVQDQNVF